MPNLLELDLSFNKFRQIEHLGIWRQCHLKQLSALGNPFVMELTDSPKNVSECSQYALERLDLSFSLNGTIPESLGRLANLRSLDLSESSLTGTIPESLGRLRYLEALDLSAASVDCFKYESGIDIQGIVLRHTVLQEFRPLGDRVRLVNMYTRQQCKLTKTVGNILPKLGELVQ
ncbi:hypothetical protein L1887_14449 [Cichorium endivia]|nr:hypothetical protein L1887_14449 [Cichorium endivia]